MEFRLDQAVPVLERTPAVMSSLLQGLPDHWLDAREGPDAWSPREIVHHLINGERTDWIPRGRVILAQGSSRPLDDLLEELDQLRAGNVATLRGWNVSEKDLDLTGEHPGLGTVTLRQLLATWVAHDLTHIAQITRTMAREYKAAVGPWTEYFRALQN